RHRELANFIRLHTVFAKLPAEGLKVLALEAEAVKIEAGAAVIREGDAVGPIFIVEEGRLHAWERQGARQHERAFLRKGDLFGELSIVRNQPRRTTVEALTECRLIKINEKTFGKLYANFPEFRNRIDERIAQYDYKRTARLP